MENSALSFDTSSLHSDFSVITEVVTDLGLKEQSIVLDFTLLFRAEELLVSPENSWAGWRNDGEVVFPTVVISTSSVNLVDGFAFSDNPATGAESIFLPLSFVFKKGVGQLFSSEVIGTASCNNDFLFFRDLQIQLPVGDIFCVSIKNSEISVEEVFTGTNVSAPTNVSSGFGAFSLLGGSAGIAEFACGSNAREFLLLKYGGLSFPFEFPV
jgi:hypothetical protein